MFRHKDVVISLKNVKRVVMHHTGTGVKSNPYEFWITIDYFGNEDTTLRLGRITSEEAEKIFETLLNTIDKPK